MHTHPLQISEVFAEICSHLDCRGAYSTSLQPGVDRRQEKRALAALATTCRAFTDSAVDVLWQEQTIDNLLGCLPPDLLVIDGANTHTKKMVGNSDCCRPRLTMLQRLLRPVMNEDWKRCRIYSPRIQALFPSSISADVLPTINACLPSDLFSKLQSLTWAGSDFSSFLRPTITEFLLYLQGETPPPVLATLGQTCPKLKNTYIYPGHSSTDFVDTFSCCIRSLASPERIIVYTLDWETL